MSETSDTVDQRYCACNDCGAPGPHPEVLPGLIECGEAQCGTWPAVYREPEPDEARELN